MLSFELLKRLIFCPWDPDEEQLEYDETLDYY